MPAGKRINKNTQFLGVRRPAQHTIGAIVDAAKAAQEGLVEMPAHVFLPDEVLPFWQSIREARSRREWIDTDFPLAAELCRVLYQIEQNARALHTETAMVVGPAGTAIRNPRLAVLSELRGSALKFYKALQISPSTYNGQQVDLTKRRNMEKNMRANLGREPTDDEMDAKPAEKPVKKPSGGGDLSLLS